MKKRIASIFTLMMLLMVTSSEAAEIKSVLVTDFNNSVLTVSGVAEEDMVSITVVPEGTQISAGEYAGTDDSNISIQYAEVTDNEFSVSFNFSVDTDNYDVYISGCQEPYNFQFVNRDLILQFVEDLGERRIAEQDIFDMLSYFDKTKTKILAIIKQLKIRITIFAYNILSFLFFIFSLRFWNIHKCKTKNDN